MTFFFYRRDREDKEKVKKARFAFLRAKRSIERKKERYEDIERYLRVVVDKTTTYAFRDTQLFENTFGNTSELDARIIGRKGRNEKKGGITRRLCEEKVVKKKKNEDGRNSLTKRKITKERN